MSNLRPLSAELKLEGLMSTGGWHDITRSVVTSKSLSNNVVALHESIHDRMLRETHFGWVQLILRLAFQAASDDTIRHRTAAWSEGLLASSTITHEVAATYLSIKQCSGEDFDDVLAQHPEQYKDYYASLASIVDHVFLSSYVQFMVGLTITEFAMCSPIIERLTRQFLPNDVSISSHESPDVRLTTLLPLVAEKLPLALDGLNLEIEKARRIDQVVPDIDIQSESAWLALSITQSKRLEDVIQKHLRAWMRTIVDECELPTVPPEDWEAPRMAFVEAIESHVGPVVSRNKYSFLERLTLDSAWIGRALSAGRSAIANTHMPPGFNPKVLPDDRFAPPSFFDDKDTDRFLFSSYKSSRSGKQRDWLWLTWPKQGSMVGRMSRLSVEQAMAVLQYRQQCAMATGYYPQIDAIVIQVSAMDASENELMNRLFHLHVIPGGGTLAIERLVWYVSGDFWRWYDVATADGNGEFFHTYPDTERFRTAVGQLDAERPNDTRLNVLDKYFEPEGGQPCWIALRNRRLPGVFARLFPAQVHNTIMGIVGNDYDIGGIANSSDETKQSVGDTLLKAQRWLLALSQEL